MARDKDNPIKGDTTVAQSRRATFDFEIVDSMECGMVLVGTEVKSLRMGGGNMSDAYAQIHRGELYLHGMKIAPYTHGNQMNHPMERIRKLLAHEHEIKRLEDESRAGLQLVPMRVYFKGGRAKVQVGIGRPRKKVDKRAAIKERDVQADLRRVGSGRRARDYDEE
jgi:SsrA-binding protein